MATTLDTLRIVKRLREAGLDERQAETITDVLRETRELDLSNLATKADLADLRLEMERRFAGLKAEIERRFAGLEAEIERRFAGLEARIGVLHAELAMLKWMIGGVGFGLLLLIVRSFWPG